MKFRSDTQRRLGTSKHKKYKLPTSTTLAKMSTESAPNSMAQGHLANHVVGVRVKTFVEQQHDEAFVAAVGDGAA